jgi:hypothetical protein
MKLVSSILLDVKITVDSIKTTVKVTRKICQVNDGIESGSGNKQFEGNAI